MVVKLGDAIIKSRMVIIDYNSDKVSFADKSSILCDPTKGAALQGSECLKHLFVHIP